MHIPDGYLSPETCAVMYVVATPFWITAGRRVKRVVTSRYVPLIAIGAAYCFLVMMFNVPIPNGTTAHAAGAVLIACLLGPWAAVIAMSTALLIQALFFGDGGVLAFAANCVNMAVLMPFAGYAVYRLITRPASLTSPRRALAAGIGGYVGLNVSALAAAIEFGLQPSLFRSADGTPLYAPFGLAQTIPTMMLAHLFIAGVVEGVLTAGVITYLQRANQPLLQLNDDSARRGEAPVPSPRRVGFRWAVVGLAGMALLTPVGLIAPGTAFGEEAPEHLDLTKHHLDAVPSGLRHYAGFFHNALFDGYGFADDEHPVVGYLVSAMVGLVAIALVVMVSFKVVRLVQRARAGTREHLVGVAP
jgi:cobalt/nickel transport system permease protein